MCGEYSKSNENASATLFVCIVLRNMWQSGFARNGKIVTTDHVSAPASVRCLQARAAPGLREPGECPLTALVNKLQNGLDELSCSLLVLKALFRAMILLSRQQVRQADQLI